MASKDVNSKTAKAIAFRYDAQSIPSGNTIIGGIVDTTGFEALDFIMQGGTISEGLSFAEWNLVLLESDTQSNFVEVDQDFLITENDQITFENQEISVGYIGKKRFVQVTIKRTGGAMTAVIETIGVLVVGAAPHHVPNIPPSVIFP